MKSKILLGLAFIALWACDNGNDVTKPSDDSLSEKSSSSVQDTGVLSSSSQVDQSSATVDESSSSLSSSKNEVRSSSSAVQAKSSSSAKVYTNYDPVTGILTDERDGKIYKTVTIGSQTWLAENLAYDLKDADGYEAFYCPNDDASNCAIYGNVYDQRAFLDEYDEGVNYPAVPESQRPFKGICPTGWHVPSIEEWQVLLDNAYVQDLVAESAGGTGKSGFDVLLAGGLSLNGSLYYEKAGLFASVDDYDIRNMASVKISATSASALKVICNYFVSVRCLMN